MSDSSGECIHEMTLGTCAICQERAERHSSAPKPGQFRRGTLADPVYVPPVGTLKTAQYYGFCTECKEPIEVGETIRLNDEQKWVHSEC